MSKNKLPFKGRIFLAPLEEVNDIAFRKLCKQYGADLTWTPLTNPLNKQKQQLQDKPVLQLFCTNKKGIASFMKKHDKEVSGWDFNLGCPATNAKKHGFGAYLKDLNLIQDILECMRKNTKKFLCVKIRKSSFSLKILSLAEKLKLDAICIHPRTVSQGYSGKADVDFALEFKKKSKIPVIYSGDINEKNFQFFLENFDAIMIGRATIGHPEIFSKIKKKKYSEVKFKDYLSLAKKHKLYFRNIKFQAMNFTKGKNNSRKLREKISLTKNLEEIKEIFDYKLPL
jgi:tRNA-dihydrouridine synthase B